MKYDTMIILTNADIEVLLNDEFGHRAILMNKGVPFGEDDCCTIHAYSPKGNLAPRIYYPELDDQTVGITVRINEENPLYRPHNGWKFRT